MNILVINAGSSSLKYQLIDIASESMLLKGICERIGMKGGSISQKTADGRTFRLDEDMPTHKEAIELVLKALVDEKSGAISSVSEIGAVGHRVLHSGEDFHSSVVIDDEVVRICEKNAELGPLHMPGNIACIKSCREVMPGVPMVAVFDTTFHSTMPPKAFMYSRCGAQPHHHLSSRQRLQHIRGQGRQVHRHFHGLHPSRRAHYGDAQR